ncbi:alpha/beta-hydrolase [Ceratobasidium sp. AG-I]|nr:alpha/beta-hydrolase [Ceratobasidium sp. AG-I]
MPQLDIPGGISASYFSFPDPTPSPARPTILFLSALFQKAEIQFEPQLRDPRLAGAGAEGYAFNFVGIDVHGHGNTTGRESWDYADNASDVVTAMTSLGVDKFFVFGTSNGGLTAQELAIRHPENVRGVVLCGTTAQAFGEDLNVRFREFVVPRWMVSEPPPNAALMGSCPTTLGAYAKPVDKPGSVFGDRSHMQMCGERTAESAVGLDLLCRIVDNWRTHTGEARVVRPVETMLNWPGSESRLAGVKAPVLVLHGVDDPTLSITRGEQIFSLLAEHQLNRLVKLDGKGAHLINIPADVALEVNAATRQWLDECIKAGL